ncbi:MAG TPA: DUF4337 domain-containing protein [Longimicrobium sp.]|nr:DUF4337 domain-containing protein [Longimicrobium sp.]
MEPTDAAELISEIREERAEHAEEDRFRDRAAMLIAIMAMLLAVGSLGGGNVAEDMIHNNIKASDTWAFFQAKNVRQTQYRIAVEQMEAQLASDAGLSPESRASLQQMVERYRATIARYDDEPDPAAPGDSLRGEGKKQLSAQARRYEALRERAGEQDTSFDYSEVAFQLAIVLGSVAILALSRKVLYLSMGLGAVGLLLMVNGFLLLFRLPF